MKQKKKKKSYRLRLVILRFHFSLSIIGTKSRYLKRKKQKQVWKIVAETYKKENEILPQKT